MGLPSRPEGRLGPSSETSRRIKVGGRIRTVRVSDDLWEKAQKVAAERGESISEVIRRSLEEYVDNVDEQHGA